MSQDYPAPVVSSRDGVEPARWPSSFVTMNNYAAIRGWGCLRQYSRGCLSHSTTSRPLAEKDLYGLRMHAADMSRWAWMVHDGTSWKSMCIWASNVQPIVGELGVTAMHEWIDGVADPLAWRGGALAAVMRAGAARKRDQARESAARRSKVGSGQGM